MKHRSIVSLGVSTRNDVYYDGYGNIWKILQVFFDGWLIKTGRKITECVWNGNGWEYNLDNPGNRANGRHIRFNWLDMVESRSHIFTQYQLWQRYRLFTPFPFLHIAQHTYTRRSQWRKLALGLICEPSRIWFMIRFITLIMITLIAFSN